MALKRATIGRPDGCASGSDDEHTGLLSGARRPPVKASPPLSLLTFSTLAYFSVCGGPFGLELAVGAAGPGRVIGALLTLALLWALPVALMTAELSSALPSSSGYMHWVGRAFGPRCGALNGWFAMINNCVDSSTYPSMFCDYLSFVLQALRLARTSSCCCCCCCCPFLILLTSALWCSTSSGTRPCRGRRAHIRSVPHGAIAQHCGC
jgi:amino acid transporter